MNYPLIDRHIISELKLVHAFYNTSVAALFFYHGWLGTRIRRQRKAKGPLPFPLIRRHRKMGPLLVVLGALGFCIGCTLVLLDTGNILEYQAHFLTGSAILLLLIGTFLVSRKIKGADSPYRNPHFLMGIAILSLYGLEIILGLGALF